MMHAAGNPFFLYFAMLFAGLSLLAPSARWLRPAALFACLAMAAHFLFWKLDIIGLAMAIALIAIVSARWARTRDNGAEQPDANEDEQLFLDAGVPGLEPRKARELLAIGHWHEIGVGQKLMHQGQDQPFLQFIARGAAKVMDMERVINVCGPGDFLGEMSLISSEPASATVMVSHQGRVLAFDPDTLIPLIEREPAIRSALHAGMSKNLSAKVSRMNRGIAG